MKLSFDWLSEYVDLSGISAQEVADKLTMGAFEVEEVTPVRPPIVGPVVVGEILEIYAHPDPKATKIRMTKTRVAPGQEPLEIVCGAPNIEVGMRIPVALCGSRVVDRTSGKPLAIEAREVRGVKSNGMLCSPPELGLPADPDAGILVLPHSADHPIELGTNVIDLLYLQPDWILHVEPRSNRGDALSVVGLAREVAALLKRPLKQPEWKLPSEQVKEGELNFTVEVERSDDCPFFSARIISGVAPGESPAFIQRRLEAVGVRTVNGIVDITNYVMHEFGQPLHAYDYRQVKGQTLKVRRAKPGEKLTTLDAKERELTDEILVIADGQEPVGVAGIMGGKDSEIADDTGNIVLEAAAFNPARVRRASRFLGLSSESSLRFERGVDVASVARASARATYLILQHCGKGNEKPRLGKVVQGGHDAVRPVHVTCRMKELKRVLGAEFTPEQVKALLAPLGFEVVKGADSAVQVTVPSFRQRDVSREIDIVEEVCRLWGYENLPESMPVSNMAPERPNRILDNTRDILCGLGLTEAWLSSLTGGGDDALGLFDEQKAVRVLNPLSAEHQVLRQNLLPGLIKAVSYNYDRGKQSVWLFEVGRVYLQLLADEKVAHDRYQAGTGVLEEHHCAGIVMGSNTLSEWTDHRRNEIAPEFDFYHAKGIVEDLMKKLRVDIHDRNKVRFVRTDKVPASMHPSRTCQIVYDPAPRRPKGDEELKALGWIAQMHPALSDSFRFKQPAYMFEVNIDALEALSTAAEFEEIPTTPSVSRDLTVDLFEAVDHAAVQSCINSAAGPDLRKVDLVSVYQPADTLKSLSFRLTFQNSKNTLTNEEVDTKLAKVREALVSRLSASFRA